MIDFVDVEEAKRRSGLRLVLVPGLPSPWSEAAKGILHAKKIPFAAVRMPPGQNPVTEWTGQQSAPVAMHEDERPRGGWAEILLLAERLEPDPPLVPADPWERAVCLGLAHEICGEMGLGWCRRLAGIDASLESDGRTGFAKGVAQYLAPKYGWQPGCGAETGRRVIDLLGMLARRLEAQRRTGSPYYLGEALTAVDVYSAAFMALFKPLPPEQCPMLEPLRQAFESLDPATAAALDPALLAHRDFVYEKHLLLPLEF